MATKTTSNAIRALEARSSALLPVLLAAAAPGTRRHRTTSAAVKKHQKAVRNAKVENGLFRGAKQFQSSRSSWSSGNPIDDLRQNLEKQASNDDSASSDRDGRSTVGLAVARAPKRLIHQNDQRYQLFKRLVEGNFRQALDSIGPQELSSVGVTSKDELMKEAVLFRRIIAKAFTTAQEGITERQHNPYFWAWRNAFVTGDARGLMAELRHSFISFTVRQHLSSAAIACHEKLADFRFPHEWFPATRTMQRTIHLHVGPTNSGKTYNALKALENAKTGIFAGPLRLLAHEIYMRLLAKKRRVALLTGDELKIPEGDEEYLASCTVEMTPLNKRVDVAVIDEIQMIGDDARGWAWTQAVLGIQAKELHLCGEDRAVPLIKALCAKTGDEVVVHRYNRLSPLAPAKYSLQGNFQNLQKGDCVVSFSRLSIHGLKRAIEEATGKKCAIIYGSLPPETRAQQAALFNDPNNDYDYLAASDAIGMGLNLEVKRVIFETVTKFDGTKMRILTLPELKQIGGRAGRFKSAARAISDATTAAEPVQALSKAESRGIVATLEEADMDIIKESFDRENPPLKAAGLFPPNSVVEKFASYFPANTPMTFILLRLRDIAKLSGDYQMCSMSNLIDIARVIEELPLSIQDRCAFLAAPVSTADPNGRKALHALAYRVAHNLPGDILDMPEFDLEILDYTPETYPFGANHFLRNLESLHKNLTLYLWLSYRFHTVFRSQRVAFHAKAEVEKAIDASLAGVNYSASSRQRAIKSARAIVRKNKRKTTKVFGDGEDVHSPTKGTPDVFGLSEGYAEGHQTSSVAL